MLFRLCGVREWPPHRDLECLGPLFRISLRVPLLDDTPNFAAQKCLICDRSWVDWDLVGHTLEHLVSLLVVVIVVLSREKPAAGAMCQDFQKR